MMHGIIACHAMGTGASKERRFFVLHPAGSP